MKIYKYIIPFLILGVLSGCQDYLEIEPKGEVVPTNVKELGQLISGGLQTMGFGTRVCIMMSDEFTMPEESFNSIYEKNKQAYMWKPPFDTGDDDFDWRNFYKHIYLCNYVLSQIDNAPLDGLIENDRNEVKASALTIRAYSYLELVNVYGAHYNPENASNDMAIPMLLVPDLEARLPRSSVEDVYNQVIGDLLDATVLFKSDALPYNKIDPSKTGAYGILSRAYLYKGDWENTLKYATLALNNHSSLYRYSDYDKSTAPELKTIDYVSNIENIFRRAISQTMTGLSLKLESDLVTLFEPGDLRLTFFTDTDDDGNKIYIDTRLYAMSGITTQEVLLSRAEANARLGHIAETVNDLNTLRTERFSGTPPTLSPNDKQEALKLVLEEREKELMFMGLRWYDMKRLVVLGEYNKTLTRTMKGETAILAPGSDKYIVKISPAILEWNTSL